MHSGLDQMLGSPVNLPGEPENKYERPKRSKRPDKKLLLVTAGIVLLLGLGFAGWNIIQSNNQPEPVTSVVQEEPEEIKETEQFIADIPQTPLTEEHVSARPRLRFNYPEDWEVTQTSDNGIRIESPTFEYETQLSESVMGHFRIYIRQSARESDSAIIGRGTAIQSSQTLSYSDPVANQRTDTNLSFFGLDTTEHFAFFLVAGNFELKTGETLGPDYGKEAEAYIISGGFSSEELKDDMATHKVPLDYYQKSNAYQAALDIIKSLKIL